MCLAIGLLASSMAWVKARDIPSPENTGVVEGKFDERARTLRLTGPSLDEFPQRAYRTPTLDQREWTRLNREYPLFATAQEHLSPLFRHDKKKPYVIGYVRYGQSVRASKAVGAPGCSRGTWHQVPGGALACSAEGFSVGDMPAQLPARYAGPDVTRVEPYRYVKAHKGAPRFLRIPTAEEQARALAMGPVPEDGRGDLPDVMHEYLNGAYFLAVDRVVATEGRRYYHTSMDRYVRVEDTTLLEPTGMHGELLSDKNPLPIAFVFGEKADLFRLRGKQARVVGEAEKHARFAVARIVKRAGRMLVVGPDNLAVARDRVRIADPIDRPVNIPAGSKWMHIDLAEQTLVAYDEKDRPVLATLVSSGLDGHRTPTGTYRLQRRYITKTMEGPDPDHGVYEVGEVPWTFYYRGNYAVHGAYWHNVFGQQRSHGCTNIPPADARWLFNFFDPGMPEGWHARLRNERGWAHFTR